MGAKRTLGGAMWSLFVLGPVLGPEAVALRPFPNLSSECRGA